MKPVHPLVVHFPIALLALSVTADVSAFFAGSDSLRSTGWWSLLGAALGGTLTVLAGLFDMRRADPGEDVHERVHRHMKVGFGLLAAILGLTFWRWTIYTQPARSVSAICLDCALQVPHQRQARKERANPTIRNGTTTTEHLPAQAGRTSSLRALAAALGLVDEE